MSPERAAWRACRAGPLGRKVASINLLNWVVDNSGGAIISGMGATALGTFNAASVLARQPALQLVQTLQSLLFATASAIDPEPLRVRRLYLSALSMVSLVIFPIYGYFVFHADLLVTLVFGRQWHAAGPVLAALSLGMVAMALSAVTSSVLTATGGQHAVIRSQVLCFGLMLPGLMWASMQSVTAIAWVVSIAFTLRFVWQVTAVVRSGAVGSAEVLGTLQGPLVMGTLAALPLTHWWRPTGLTVADEAVSLTLVAALELLMIRLLPRFFVTLACIEVLKRVASGRWLMRALGLHPLVR